MSTDPSAIDDHPAPDGAGPTGCFGRFRWLAVLIGIVLVIAAVIAVWRQQEVVADALAAAQRPAVRDAAVLVGGVVANVILSGLLFSALMSRYGKVGVLEMQALIASATLLNYLPLRPGLFGRIAYHKAVNRILAAHSARVVVQASLISLAIVGYLAAVLLISGTAEVSLWYGVLAPLLLLPACAMAPSLRIWAWAALVRYVEVFVWAARYHAAFAIVGSPIDATGAIAFACVSMIATMVPLVSNGLGLREWAIGLTAPLLSPYVLELGITAELINRAAELVVIVVLGLIGAAYLARRRGSAEA